MTLIGSGLGLVNSYLQNQRAQDLADQQRKIEKAKAKWYGWTQQAPQAVTDPNLMGNLLQGGIGGFLGGADIIRALRTAKGEDKSSVDQLLEQYKADAARQQSIGPAPQLSQWQQVMYPQQRNYGLGANTNF